ncbi:MAG TPA: hypothetical protein VLH56_19645 [Dissulfurispiraceae bacterium]|nr:hypothetical protein [Dissulfurispiraceae bacterium]
MTVKRRNELEQTQTTQEEKASSVVDVGQEVDDSRSLGDYVDEAEGWLSTIGAQEDEVICVLYKYDDEKAQKQFVCDEYEGGQVPGIREIRERFGAGSYRVMVRAKDASGRKHMRAYRVNIAADMLAKKETKVAVLGQGMEAIQQVSILIKALEPIISLRNSVSAPVPVANPMDQFSIVNEIAKESMKQSFEMMGEYRKRMMRLEPRAAVLDEEEEDDNSHSSQFQTILELAQKFLPMILQSGPSSKAVVQALKTSPEFKKIVNDKRKTAALISEFDSQFGKEKTDAVLKKVGISRGGK